MAFDRALAAVDLDVEARVAGMDLDGHDGVGRAPRAAAALPPCMATGVQRNAAVPAASTGPPAAIEYALEPSAVATTSPSPAMRT